MNPAVEFHPDAADEAVAAQKWYQAIDVDLGVDFEDELSQALDRIAAAPHRWARHLGGTRCFLLERFPYLIVYLHDEAHIQVVAVQHVKRKPGYWKERLN